MTQMHLKILKGPPVILKIKMNILHTDLNVIYKFFYSLAPACLSSFSNTDVLRFRCSFFLPSFHLQASILFLCLLGKFPIFLLLLANQFLLNCKLSSGTIFSSKLFSSLSPVVFFCFFFFNVCFHKTTCLCFLALISTSRYSLICIIM